MMNLYLALAAFLGFLALCLPRDAGAAIFFADNFNTVSYANNDGTVNWTGSWVEDDPAGGGAGPSAGNVRVAGGFLILDDQPDTGGNPSATREFNLTAVGATKAFLEFAFNTTSGVDSDDAVTVEASSNGGASFETLEVITGITGSQSDNRFYEITDYISNDSQVSFRVSDKYGATDEFFQIDQVKVSAIPEPSAALLSMTPACFFIGMRRRPTRRSRG